MNTKVKKQMEILEADVQTVLVPGSIKPTMKSLEASSRDLWMLDPFKLEVIEGLNPRVMNEGYKAHLRELTESMKSEGFYQDKPLAGYVMKRGDEQVVVIYEGGSRLLAARQAIEEGAEFTKVPVSVKMDGVALEDILVNLVRGNQGRPLTPYENAIVCKRLARCGWENDQIAKRLGFSTTTVANLLMLIAAPHQIREMVATELVSATHAIEVINKHGEKALEVLQSALNASREAGKTRVTARFAPGATFKKLVKKSADSMFATLTEVRADPGFDQLSSETKEKLAKLVQELEAAQQAAEATVKAQGEPAEEGAASPAENATA